MRKRTWKSVGFCLLMAVGLLLSYYLCRYPLYDLHQMKQWSMLLLNVGSVLMAAAVLGNAPCTCLAIGPGYLLSFFIGYLLQFDYGIGLNSHWWIWTLAYLILIILGFAADCIHSNREVRAYTR